MKHNSQFLIEFELEFLNKGLGRGKVRWGGEVSILNECYMELLLHVMQIYWQNMKKSKCIL